VNAAMTYADGFVNLVNSKIPANGSISEQFNRNTSEPLSARDLTWSYASYVTMHEARRAAMTLTAAAREPIQVASWGSRQANTPPSVCVGSSAPGNYSAATGAGAPPGAGGCFSTVTFNVNASTYFGENVYMTGNVTELGNWDVNNALPGNAGGYTSQRPLWTFGVDLPAGEPISYKYVRQESDGSWLYETGNRTYTVPACGNPTATVEDAWVGPTGTPS